MEKPEQWAKIKEIVGAALDRDQGQRASFLDQACADDGELRAEVESLLAAHADAGGLSGSPWAATVADPVGEAKVLGSYRLVKILGLGGMGQVWLAEQTEPVHRRVALKLIRAGIYDAALIKRFQSERQSLAIMDHPTIAKVFDAGATPDGQPYLAMEYVDGVSITDYCDRKKLGIHERLKLFTQVCEGVQHAHQKAIIHRDLKPSNILVTEVDCKPVPRIIDFGLAKAVAPVPGETLFTHVGAFLGTPGYMSPEQADPELHDVDTRTDVYSLGVVLYELLTGFLPFDTTQWKKQRLDEVLRQLRETDPERPSTKVSSGRETSTARAEARATEPGQLVSQLRGDLDWITLTALEKDRNRRYGTPSALAADVANYLENRPVQARPASAGYRLRKYVRRNRIAVAVASGAAVLLVAFAVMQSVELRRITRERDRADRITEFMTNMFKVSDPSEARGNTITAREILDKSSKEIDTGLAKDPEMKAKMLDVMGTVYESMGLYPQARTLLTRAVDIRRSVLGPANPDTLHSLDNLGWTLVSAGQYAEAEKLQRQTLAIERSAFGSQPTDIARSTSRLAGTLLNEGQEAEAEKLYREALEIYQRALGPEHRDTLGINFDLALTLHEEGRYPEAEKLQTETLEIQRRVLGTDHPDTLRSMRSLASVFESEGRLAEAEKLCRETFEMERRVLGPEHQETLRSMTKLALTIQEEGRLAEAEILYRQTLDIKRRALGSDHPEVTESVEGLALVLAHEGQYGEMETLFREAVQTASKTPTEGLLGDVWYDFAAGAALTGHRDEAIQELHKAVQFGSRQVATMANDDDLKNLRDDPRFQAIVTQFQQRAVSTTQKPN